jgi:hypothetical protein
MADQKPSSVPATRPKADKPVATAPGEEPEKKEGWLGWTLGWIVAPGAVLGAIFGGGVLLGAHFSDGWFARAVMWVAGLFG